MMKGFENDKRVKEARLNSFEESKENFENYFVTNLIKVSGDSKTSWVHSILKSKKSRLRKDQR